MAVVIESAFQCQIPFCLHISFQVYIYFPFACLASQINSNCWSQTLIKIVTIQEKVGNCKNLFIDLVRPQHNRCFMNLASS